jgi:formate dehydrogenase iron-sulfur subunit
MSSDVCKHCTHAACLDVCPTGALFRTEFGTVVVQEDICNGCGYCVPACPFGVIDREREDDGRAAKVHALLRPAEGRARAGVREGVPDRLDPVRRARRAARARRRAARAAAERRAWRRAALRRDPDDGVGGAGAFFLLLDEPEVYGLPPDPVVTTRDLGCCAWSPRSAGPPA